MNVIRDNERPTAVLGFLRPLDTQRIAQQLKLESRGTERGSQNLPGVNERMLDAVEQEIIQRIESEWTWQRGELINNLRAYADRLLGYSIPAEYEKLRLTSENALTRLRSATKRALAELGPLQESYLGARKELETFKVRNRLERPPRQPARRWTTIGILFVLVAVEAVLNSFFFAKGSELGLVGGVGIAIIISGVNIVFAFFIGLWPARWAHHRSFSVRFTGLFLLLLGVAVLLLLHGFAVHLREQTALVGEEKAFAAAVASFFQRPWNVTDLSSLYLFLLGIFFGLSAMWKGHSLDDPYPGYGAVHRRMAAARDSYSDEHALLFDDLDDIKEDTVDALKDGIDRMPGFPQHAARIRTERVALVQAFRAYETAVETAANQLLAKYRDSNRAARNEPAPAHFDEHWSLKTFVDSGDVQTLLVDPPEPPIDINQTLLELRRRADALLTEYSALLTRYPHPSEMA
jgi:hypothetical protein